MLKIIPLVVLAAICFADTDELDVRLRPMVVWCGNAQLPALPISRAPFERSAEVSRRPVALATFPFFARNSGAGPNYAQRYVQTDAGMRYHLRSPAKKVVAHILLLEGKTPKSLFVNGEEAQFKITTVGESRYVDTTVAPKDGVADFELPF